MSRSIVDAGHLATLAQRRDWLTARITAKQQVGWDVVWDYAERDALTWALERLHTNAPARGVGYTTKTRNPQLAAIEDDDGA